MEHSFNVEIAAEYGIHTAILLKNIHFWIEKNRANEKHFYDGRYWTYNSKKAFSELFPYLTERQVKYTLEKMKKDDLILVGNYNQDSYDKTNWYTLTDKALELLGCTEKTAEKPETIDRTKLSNRMDKSVPIDWTKLSNGQDKIVQPIPDSKPDNKLKEKNIKKESEKNKESDKGNYSLIEEQLVFEEIKKLSDKEISDRVLAVFRNKKDKNKPITKTALKVLLDRLERFSGGNINKKIDILDVSVSRGYTDIYELNQKNNYKHSAENLSYNLGEYEFKNNADYEKYLFGVLDKI